MPYFFILLYWLPYTIEKYGNLSPFLSWGVLFLLSLYLSIFYAFLFYAIKIARLLKNPTFFKGLVVGLLWCGTEFLRANLFTGFSWGELGYLLSNFPLLLQIADIFGIWGLSLVVILINYFFFFIFYNKVDNKINKVSLFLFITFFSFLIFYGIWCKAHFSKIIKKAPEIRVAILQGNVPQEIKNESDISYSLNTYLEMFVQIPPNTELVLTPETALPFFFPDDPPSMPVLNFFKKKKSTFVIGAFRLEKKQNLSPKYYNTLFVIKNGQIVDFYDKEKLVPFGEYVPLANYLSFLKKFTVGLSSLSPGYGKNLKLPLAKEKISATPLICFESAFSELLRKRVKESQLVLIATNDAWFDKSSAPFQHFQMAIVRAVEARKYILQAANTGISGIIDPLGKVIKKSRLNQRIILYGKVKLIKKEPLFATFGDILGKSGALLLILLLIYLPLKNKFSRKALLLSLYRE